MSYHSRINFLRESLVLLNNKIEQNKSNKEELVKLIEQRSLIHSELSSLQKLQWEEDHERVNLDDDR
jgi:flagellar hook-associated protein FlgK